MSKHLFLFMSQNKDHKVEIGYDGCAPGWVEVKVGDSLTFASKEGNSVVCLDPVEIFGTTRLVIKKGQEKAVKVSGKTAHRYFVYTVNYNAPDDDLDTVLCPASARAGGGGEVSPPGGG